MLAPRVGSELTGCEWVGVPFAGGMCELRYIKARSVLVSDLHRHVINLARVVAHPLLGPKLYRRLRRTAFHPDELAAAQERCLRREDRTGGLGDLFSNDSSIRRHDDPDLDWAVDYFTAVWMARGGNAGTDGEFRGGLSLRWDAGGGDSNTRFRSAAASLAPWRRVMRRCNFVTEDVFDFLARVKDRKGNGLYIDSPWPSAGDGYRHKFTTADQRRLAKEVSRFSDTRVVIRFGVHPLIEELYPRDHWNWQVQTSRSQANGDVPEALIINGPSYAEVA